MGFALLRGCVDDRRVCPKFLMQPAIWRIVKRLIVCIWYKMPV